MTVPIALDSPRRIHAQRFAAELRRAMAAKGASTRRLSEAAHVTTSAVGMWKAGANLPTPAVAARVAEVLEAPRLLEISRASRTRACKRCRRPFVALMGSMNQWYCTQGCRDVDAALRRPQHGASLYEGVRAATDARLAGEAEEATLRATLDALRTYQGSAARAVQRRDIVVAELDAHRDAIAAMCASCEPEGLCRTPECALRAYSPLPLAGDRSTASLREPEGPWGPTNRDAQLTAIREANQRRWSRPGEREAASAANKARLAALTPEEREERGRRISAGIDREKRAAASRAMHAARRAAS